MKFVSVAFLFVFAAVGMGFAQEMPQITVMMGDLPPYNSEENGKAVGIYVDILNEVQTMTGLQFAYRIAPWKRAQTEAKSNPNHLITTLARTPERENEYKWVAVVRDAKYVIVTGKDTPAPQSIEEAKKLRIGVVIGSVLEKMLKDQGFIVEQVASMEQNLKKLQAKRIDGWASDDVSIYDTCKKAGYDPANLQIGMTVYSTPHYLAASPDFPDSVLQKIREAVESLKSSGKIDQIIEKYR